MAAKLLAGLSLQDIPVLGSGFVQSLVSVLVVHQRAAPPVQQVLQQSHDHTFNSGLLNCFCIDTHCPADTAVSQHDDDDEEEEELTLAACDSLR